jgi:hypothetical protein
MKKVKVRGAKTQLPKAQRELGTEREHMKIAEDFDAPLPMPVLAAFLGGGKRRKGRRS